MNKLKPIVMGIPGGITLFLGLVYILKKYPNHLVLWTAITIGLVIVVMWTVEWIWDWVADWMFWLFARNCPECKGRGKVWNGYAYHPCLRCGGKGRV